MDLHSNFQSLYTQEQGLVEEETAPFPSCTEIKRERELTSAIKRKEITLCQHTDYFIEL